MPKKSLLPFIFLVIGLIGVGLVLVVYNPFQKREVVRLGLAPDIDYLTVIAIQKGFFFEEGLDVTVIPYDTGKNVLGEGVLKGNVDVGIVGLTPLVLESFNRDDFKIITTTTTVYNLYNVVARNDHGIRVPKDLRGKTIATVKGTSFHYFLVNFISLNKLDGQVEIKFIKTDEMAKALISGEVDAATLREPFISEATTALGNKITMFGQPILPSNTFNLVAMDPIIATRPEALRRLVSALNKAEDFAINQREESITLVAQNLDQPVQQVKDNWENIQVQVGLRQEMLLEMENIAGWAIASQLTDKTEIPYYLDFFYYDALEAINPYTINIIR